jgi:endonuclease/exonuclease/phosphatase family metal-dependent hydrolase
MNSPRIPVALLIRSYFVLFLVFRLSPFAGADPGEVVIATYNIENYLGEEAENNPAPRHAKPKSEKEIAAVTRVIKDMNADILGVCEMGSAEEFAVFMKRLEAEGLGYVDSDYVAGPDPDRHLALVSRFPIVSRESLPDVPFEMNGQPQKVRRGFLDVTIQVNAGYRLRMVGTHLKSKLPIAGGEALMRRYEAQLLRKHLERILNGDPQVNLACYGDFNDTKNEMMFQTIAGMRGSPAYMADLPACDELGDRWTQYWKAADLYSRIDYIFVSPALHREVVLGKSRVYRSEYWNEASDHRPVMATVIPINKPFKSK